MNSWRAVRGYLRRHELIADAAFAVALCGSGVVVWAIGPRASWPRSWPLALLWSAISLSTLVIRRRRTRFAVVGLTAHTVAALLVFRDLRV
ncbi:MAG: hypothetical protein QOE03_203, partial [Micromonosporaceae bacterium]|nr:hypothetical protein [Micromonosporaceae bacterium]